MIGWLDRVLDWLIDWWRVAAIYAAWIASIVWYVVAAITY